MNTAIKNNINPGDILKLHFFISVYPSGDWFFHPFSYAPSYTEFWDNDLGEAEFEVIGIFQPNNNSFDINENAKILKENMLIIPENVMKSVVGNKTMQEFRAGYYLGWIKMFQ